MPGNINTMLIEGSFEELCDELAAYLDGLNAAQSKQTTLQTDVQPLLQADKKDDALDVLVKASSVLSTASEREFLAAYNLVIHLVHQSSRPDALLTVVCDHVSKPVTSSPANSVGLSLSVLTTIFNTLAPTEATRYHVLGAVLKIINTQATFDSLRPQLDNLSEWMAAWQIPKPQQRQLYLSIIDVAVKATGEEAFVQEYLLKALRTLQDGADASSTEAQALSLRAIKAALSNEKTYDYQDLTGLDSVQALRKSDSVAYDLVEIFSYKTLDDYNDWTTAHADWLSSSGLDKAVLERKIRLLTLATLCATAAQTTRQVSYASIRSGLALDDSTSVELWIIDVIRAGLVEGKMSQSTQTLLVHRATYRVFDDRQWRVVAGRLDQWKESLVEVLKVVRAEKENFIREQQQESREADTAANAAQGGKGMYRAARSYRNAVEVE